MLPPHLHFFSKSDVKKKFLTTSFLDFLRQKDPIEGILVSCKLSDKGRHLDVLDLFVWTGNPSFDGKHFFHLFFS